MKCIKCIKVAKGYELDEIRRVSDIDADERVKGGYWKFIPKSEWKAGVRKQISKDEVKMKQMKADVETQLVEIEKVKSKKQIKKGK